MDALIRRGEVYSSGQLRTRLGIAGKKGSGGSD